MQRTVHSLNTAAAALIGVAAVLLCGSALAQQPAQGAPALTLEGAAPQPAAEPLPDWMKFTDPYGKKQVDLSTAHLADEEIETWTQDRVTDALSFDPTTVNTKVTGLRTLFTDAGWASYGRLLGQMQVVENVRGKQLALSTIADGKASVVNSSGNGGAFRWLISLPVMQSLAPQGGTASNSGNHTLNIIVMRASAPVADQAGEQPLHNDLKIDSLTIAAQTTPAAVQP